MWPWFLDLEVAWNQVQRFIYVSTWCLCSFGRGRYTLSLSSLGAFLDLEAGAQAKVIIDQVQYQYPLSPPPIYLLIYKERLRCAVGLRV